MTEFKAHCPRCGFLNHFTVTEKELDNNYDMTCDNPDCERQYTLDRWLDEEVKTDFKKGKKLFNVGFVYTIYGSILIRADDDEEARDKVYAELSDYGVDGDLKDYEQEDRDYSVEFCEEEK